MTQQINSTGLSWSGRKRILDYPVMHQMLTGLFHETYLRDVQGESPKHGFMVTELVVSAIHGTPLDWDFWKDKIGSYCIGASFVSESGVTIDVEAVTPQDIFLPDTFILMPLMGTFSVTVPDSGALESIEMIFDDGMPEFSLDLIRDFPGHHAKPDKVLCDLIRQEVLIPDSALLSDFCFKKVITIEV